MSEEPFADWDFWKAQPLYPALAEALQVSGHATGRLIGEPPPQDKLHLFVILELATFATELLRSVQKQILLDCNDPRANDMTDVEALAARIARAQRDRKRGS